MRFFSLSGLYSDIQAFFAIKKRIISTDYPLVIALFLLDTKRFNFLV